MQDEIIPDEPLNEPQEEEEEKSEEKGEDQEDQLGAISAGGAIEGSDGSSNGGFPDLNESDGDQPDHDL